MKILLSIKPEYAEKILSGRKRYEFRRRLHKNTSVKTVVIYATMPVGKVVGEFTIERIHSKKPNEIWNLTKEHSGITREFFSEYFQDRDLAHAIEVSAVRRFKKPRSIGDYLKSGIAPQSYAYVE